MLRSSLLASACAAGLVAAIVAAPAPSGRTVRSAPADETPPTPALSAACLRATDRARMLYDARDDFAAAATAARSARACLAPSDGSPPVAPDSATAATALSLLSMEARARFNAEDWRGAAALIDTLARWPSAAAPTDFGVALAHAGVARVYLGRASEGLADIAAAVRLVPESAARDHAAVLRARVMARERLGDFDAADRDGDALVRFVDARVPAPHRAPMLLRALSDRASNLVLWHEHGGLPDAPRRLGSALVLARSADSLAATLGDSDAGALARLLAADALLGLRRFDEADAALQPLLGGAYGDFARWSLARLATRRGRYGDAVDRYRALLGSSAGQPDAHEIRYELASALDAAGRLPEALDAYRAATAAADAFTAATGGDDAWQDEQSVLQRPHRGLARLLARMARPADALVALDASRARLLAAARERAQALARDTPDGRRLASLLDALADARDRRQSAVDAGAPSDTLDALGARIDDLRGRLAAASPLPTLVPLDVPALQRRLGRESRVLVAYLLDRPDAAFERPGASYAFVVTADTVAALPLDTLGLGADLRGAGVFSDDGRGMSVDALRRLYDRLIAPTRTLWKGATRLTVVPDGQLFALPFAALATSGEGFNYAAARFLVGDVAVSTDIAAGLLLMPEPVRARLDSSAVFAVAAGRSRFGGALPDLPGVAEELRSVRDRLPGTRLLEDKNATEESVLAALNGARVLHLASHAVAGDALTAAIYLTPVAPTPGDSGSDGLLRLHELQSRSLPLDLAVLSGCETARGDLVPGEGMAGLQSGMRAAGALSVIATLWRVPDASTGLLMNTFYDALARGERRDDALREAQLLVRRLSPDPATWAAPVLYGDTRPLVLPPPTDTARPRLGLLLLVAIVLGCIGIGTYRSRALRL